MQAVSDDRRFSNAPHCKFDDVAADRDLEGLRRVDLRRLVKVE